MRDELRPCYSLDCRVREVSEGEKGKGQKGRNVGWKDKDDNGSGSQKDAKGKGVDGSINDPLGIALTKEMRKVEENIHTRLGRLISKELDKQRKLDRSFYTENLGCADWRYHFRPTPRGCTCQRTSRRFRAPGKDSQVDLYGID